jgi:23S rRNA (cytosine1962-C5)-methyltransferase
VELIANGSTDYRVLDSGDDLRLERLGSVVISRQSGQAIWPRALTESEWKRLQQATHFRTDDGPGEWKRTGNVPERWPISIGDLTFEMRLTGFGHVGIFAEQQSQWPWITSLSPAGSNVLNLFAYTGGSTLAAARGGANVTHVDAVKGVVQWASRNAELSGLAEHPVRWIVDDVVKFVEREERRERRYDGIILDPPTFGRGPRGRVWKIEKDLVDLIDACARLLSDTPKFMLLSGHTPGVTAAVMRNVMNRVVKARGGQLIAGDMVQSQEHGDCLLPSGVYCRWTP